MPPSTNCANTQKAGIACVAARKPYGAQRLLDIVTLEEAGRLFVATRVVSYRYSSSRSTAWDGRARGGLAPAGWRHRRRKPAGAYPQRQGKQGPLRAFAGGDACDAAPLLGLPSTTRDFPLRALCGAGARQLGIPFEKNRYLASVHEAHGQRAFCDLYICDALILPGHAACCGRGHAPDVLASRITISTMLPSVA